MMNTKPTLRLRYAGLPVCSAVLLSLVLLAGCSGKPAPAPAPDTVVKRVQDNPNLSPEAQQAALQSMQAHQTGARIRAQVMHRSAPQQ